jgi:mRNA interferase MazF
MVIRQGDVFWCDFGPPTGSGPAYLRPCVVVQNNVFNRSRIGTVVVCALTSNLQRAHAPGNVALRKGEANLPKRCVCNISQLFTLDKSVLVEKIGALPENSLDKVLAGVHLLVTPADLD